MYRLKVIILDFSGINLGDIMATEETFLSVHGLMLPKETHDLESLKFAHDFTFKDNDVLAVTYPKSGQFLFRLKHVATSCSRKINPNLLTRFYKKFTLESLHSYHFRFFTDSDLANKNYCHFRASRASETFAFPCTAESNRSISA